MYINCLFSKESNDRDPKLDRAPRQLSAVVFCSKNSQAAQAWVFHATSGVAGEMKTEKARLIMSSTQYILTYGRIT